MSVITILRCCILLITILITCPGYGHQTSQAIKKVLSRFKSTWMFNYGMMEFLAENMKAQVARTKFVLLWYKAPGSRLIQRGQTVFKTRGCLVDNCFITDDHSLFHSISYFDVLLFHAPETFSGLPLPFPYMRSSRQKYVFVSAQSSDQVPMCSDKLDDYFNMTWTYKLNSDVYFGYIIVKNKKGEIIGPKEKMDWIAIESMEPINDDIKFKLIKKYKAVAWYASDCGGTRMKVLKEIKEEMDKYGLTLDIYGGCGAKSLSKISFKECMELVETDYYFYFAFERFFSEDFVTGELLRPLKHYAIPVVYGNADYSRFIPDGIYLNAIQLGPRELVETMYHLIKHKDEYYNYFKWHNHYSYHMLEESPESDFYCQFCAKINDEKVVSQSTVVKEFRKWWMRVPFRKDICIPTISSIESIGGCE